MNAVVCRTILSAALVLAAGVLDAQESGVRGPDMRANSLYAELGGNVGDISINYDRLVGKATLVRVGFGNRLDSYGDCFGIGLVSACEGAVDVSLVGFMVSRLIGQRHMAELGFGGAFGTLTDDHSELFIGESETEKETVNTLTATVGYRWQGSGRWLVRAGYTPSYVLRGETARYSNHGFTSSIGASFGVAF